MLRLSRIFIAFVMIAACGISPALHGVDARVRNILGTPPSYGPATITTVPNLAATDLLLWAPGLDLGWNPQGLTVAEGRILLSAYQSDRFGVNRGPCRVFRVDPATGRETGHFDIPKPCGHAGGVAYDGAGRLYIADTHTLFEVELDGAFNMRDPVFRIFPLGPGLRGAYAGSDHGAIWIGTYEQDRPGKIFKYERAALEALPDRAVLSVALASTTAVVPSYAQGAAIAASGKLWVSRSEIAWGELAMLDIVSGRVVQGYVAPGGIEGISFDASGRLWAVSEAGARHIPFRYPFFPTIFQLDIERLAATH
jgi:hypothetical protein